jgi:hypothetical protein
MSQDCRDIVERLVDFDHCGVTATERLKMRMDAWNEILRLRAELAEWKQAAGVEAGLRREFLARAEQAEGQSGAAQPA